MSQIQHDSVVPLYQQLYNLIREQIQNGVYPMGSQIPSESTLCGMYGLSRVTVRSAIDHLVENNILIRMQGKGTFVSAPAQTERKLITGSFTRSCVGMGAEPGTRLIRQEWVGAEKTLAYWLNVPEGDKILRIIRVRLINGSPAIYEIDYLPKPLAFIEKMDLEHGSLLQIIEDRTGRKVDSFESTPGIRYLDRESAECLECAVGSPVLWIGQMVYSEEDAVYYNEQFIRNDRYSYSIRSIVP